MEKTNFDGMEVAVFSPRPTVSRRLLRGKAVIDDEGSRVTFVENEPRLHRSKELSRTAHCRLIRRVDGGYSATFRVTGYERYLREMLIAEVRVVATEITKDRKEVKDGEERL